MQQRGFRSSITTQGRRMAGARALWRATGMKKEDFQKPIIAIANSFTQFVPGHVHLHEVGQQVKKVIDASGGYGVEFNTIAVDDGIALVEDGDIIKIDIPQRSINLLLSEDELAERRKKMEAKGTDAYKPLGRKRPVSAALRAYAALTTSAARGAVRDVTQV